MNNWMNTYAHTFLLALDEWAAAVLFNRPDITISSLCRAVQLADAKHGDWPWRVEKQLKLGTWQMVILRVIAKGLDGTFPNHCEGARLSDLLRAGHTIKLLDDPTLDK